MYPFPGPWTKVQIPGQCRESLDQLDHMSVRMNLCIRSSSRSRIKFRLLMHITTMITIRTSVINTKREVATLVVRIVNPSETAEVGHCACDMEQNFPNMRPYKLNFKLLFLKHFPEQNPCGDVHFYFNLQATLTINCSSRKPTIATLSRLKDETSIVHGQVKEAMASSTCP